MLTFHHLHHLTPTSIVGRGTGVRTELTTLGIQGDAVPRLRPNVIHEAAAHLPDHLTTTPVAGEGPPLDHLTATTAGAAHRDRLDDTLEEEPRPIRPNTT